MSIKILSLVDIQRRCSHLYHTLSSYQDVLWDCNDVVCPLGGRYFFKKVFLILKNLRFYENPWKYLWRSSVSWGCRLKACSFTKNKLLHIMKRRFQRRIQKKCWIPSIYSISIESYSYSNNWITQLIESI